MSVKEANTGANMVVYSVPDLKKADGGPNTSIEQ